MIFKILSCRIRQSRRGLYKEAHPEIYIVNFDKSSYSDDAPQEIQQQLYQRVTLERKLESTLKSTLLGSTLESTQRTCGAHPLLLDVLNAISSSVIRYLYVAPFEICLMERKNLKYILTSSGPTLGSSFSCNAYELSQKPPS